METPTSVSAQHYGGLGLGLYVSRRIVEAHGGAIRVESRAGEGATFVVDLPCAGLSDSPRLCTSTTPQGSS